LTEAGKRDYTNLCDQLLQCRAGQTVIEHGDVVEISLELPYIVQTARYKRLANGKGFFSFTTVR